MDHRLELKKAIESIIDLSELEPRPYGLKDIESQKELEWITRTSFTISPTQSAVTQPSQPSRSTSTPNPTQTPSSSAATFRPWIKPQISDQELLQSLITLSEKRKKFGKIFT